MRIGHMLQQWLTKLDWFSTLFPRVPVPIQKQIESKLNNYYRMHNITAAKNVQSQPIEPDQGRMTAPGRGGSGGGDRGGRDMGAGDRGGRDMGGGDRGGRDMDRYAERNERDRYDRERQDRHEDPRGYEPKRSNRSRSREKHRR